MSCSSFAAAGSDFPSHNLAWDMRFDHLTQELFWSDWGRSAITHMDIASKASTNIFIGTNWQSSGNYRNPNSFDLDYRPGVKKIYGCFVDANPDRVMVGRLDYDGSNFADLINPPWPPSSDATGGGRCRALRLDLTQNPPYMVIALSNNDITTAALDGSGVTRRTSTATFNMNINGILLDLQNRRLLVSSIDAGAASRFQSVSIDTWGGVQTHANSHSATNDVHAISVDYTQDKLYYRNLNSDLYRGGLSAPFAAVQSAIPASSSPERHVMALKTCADPNCALCTSSAAGACIACFLGADTDPGAGVVCAAPLACSAQCATCAGVSTNCTSCAAGYEASERMATCVPELNVSVVPVSAAQQVCEKGLVEVAAVNVTGGLAGLERVLVLSHTASTPAGLPRALVVRRGGSDGLWDLVLAKTVDEGSYDLDLVVHESGTWNGTVVYDTRVVPATLTVACAALQAAGTDTRTASISSKLVGLSAADFDAATVDGAANRAAATAAMARGLGVNATNVALVSVQDDGGATLTHTVNVDATVLASDKTVTLVLDASSAAGADSAPSSAVRKRLAFEHAARVASRALGLCCTGTLALASA